MTSRDDNPTRDPRRIALLLEYDGTRYSGFQWQPDAPTIQSELESAIEKVTGERVRVAGAGRTDSGVHARGQVAAFLTRSELDSGTLQKALNHHLPDDIAVLQAGDAEPAFDPRRDAVSRRYRYSIWNAPTPSPLQRHRTCHVRGNLDMEAMHIASQHLLGIHDFASFGRPPAGSEASTVREVTGVSVSRQGNLVTLDIQANAFLTHQVRRTAGALVEVGLGRISIREFGDLVRSPISGAAGPTLAASGLCLEEVLYPEPGPFHIEHRSAATALAG